MIIAIDGPSGARKSTLGKMLAKELNLLYLEPEIAEFVQKLATEKNIDRSEIVNMLLKKDKEIIEL